MLGSGDRYDPANGYHYGYRFSFSKGERFTAWSSLVDSQTDYTVRNTRLDIEPAGTRLGDPARATPTDVARSHQRQAVKAAVFHGLMTSDEQGRFWLQQPVTRAKLANTLQMLPGGELHAKKTPGWMSGSDYFWPDAPCTKASGTRN